MTRLEIFDKLKDILRSASEKENLIDNCTESSELVNDLSLSSVSMLYMVIDIEEEFNIKFDGTTNISDFKKVEDVVNYIESKIK